MKLVPQQTVAPHASNPGCIACHAHEEAVHKGGAAGRRANETLYTLSHGACYLAEGAVTWKESLHLGGDVTW